MKLWTTYLSHILLQLICCVLALHVNHDNDNIRTNINNRHLNARHGPSLWFYEDEDDGNGRKHRPRIKKHHQNHLILHNYQRYKPNENETDMLATSATTSGPPQPSPPPYYLSYDSGQKSRFMPMEEKLIEQQMAYNYQSPQDMASNEKTYNKHNEFDVKSNARLSGIESQIRGTAESQRSPPNTDDIYGAHNEDGVRRVGPKGFRGTYGFVEYERFYPCDKPSRLEPDPDNRETYIIPNNIDYYHKCRYFEEDPRANKNRQVGPLGKDGYFGYFENSKFVECSPPRELVEDSQKPGLYYIPNDIDYEPKCQYYGYNVSKRFDYIEGYVSGFTANTVHMFTQLVAILLPLYLWIRCVI